MATTPTTCHMCGKRKFWAAEWNNPHCNPKEHPDEFCWDNCSPLKSEVSDQHE